MDLVVKTPNLALWGAAEFRCAVGKNGIATPGAKREGDLKTPAGRWPLRGVLYRADRLQKPETQLPLRALTPEDGWCEDPADPGYNALVRHPYPVPVDRLWREDHLYDIIVILGYNDRPVAPGLGSAIFLHLARPDYSPSAGCVTLALPDLLRVLREAETSTCVDVRAA